MQLSSLQKVQHNADYGIQICHFQEVPYNAVFTLTETAIELIFPLQKAQYNIDILLCKKFNRECISVQMKITNLKKPGNNIL